MTDKEKTHVEKTKEIVPDEVFLDPEKHSLKEDNLNRHIKIAIVSETKNVFINRNNSPKTTTSHVIDDEARVMVPGQKWKGKEQSKMVQIARELDIMPEAYKQNQIEDDTGLLNPVSIIFGDSVTADNQGSNTRGRINYDWSYSYKPVRQITKKIQHNTLEEDGTIKKDESDPTSVASSALHKTQYVIPGVKFVRFNTLTNVSAELFLFYLVGVMSTHAYGARTSIACDNMKNDIVAISFGDAEQPVSAYSLLEEYWEDGEEPGGYKEVATDRMSTAYGPEKTLTGDELEELLNVVRELMRDNESLKEMLEGIDDWIKDSYPEFVDGD